MSHKNNRMNEVIKAIVHYKTGQQYTHEHWRSVTEMIEVDGNTTIGAIVNWQKNKYEGEKSEFKPFEVTITFL